jgi:integrase/recombinase XerD
MDQLVALAASNAPAFIAAAGDRAAYRFLEFFTAQIRNPHTRRAYVRAVGGFWTWLEAYGVSSIAAVGSIHVAAYAEDLGHCQSAPTVKQHLVNNSGHASSPEEGGVQKLRDLWTGVERRR